MPASGARTSIVVTILRTGQALRAILGNAQQVQPRSGLLHGRVVHGTLGLEQLELLATDRADCCQTLRPGLPLGVRHLVGARHDERGLCVGHLGAVHDGERVARRNALPKLTSHLHHTTGDE